MRVKEDPHGNTPVWRGRLDGEMIYFAAPYTPWDIVDLAAIVDKNGDIQGNFVSQAELAMHVLLGVDIEDPVARTVASVHADLHGDPSRLLSPEYPQLLAERLRALAVHMAEGIDTEKAA
jgi:hypothetical protein